MSSVLEPLVLELGTSRQRIEALARENGRLSAELAAAQPDLTPDPSDPSSDAPRPRLRLVWPLLTFWTVVSAVLALVLAGVLLGWPR